MDRWPAAAACPPQSRRRLAPWGVTRHGPAPSSAVSRAHPLPIAVISPAEATKVQAWMWRLTDQHAVLFTDDRATLNAVLGYGRFPYKDVSRATTYASKRGRI